MESKFASRKFGLATFVVISALGLRLGNFIDAATWMQATYVVLGLYFTGNVVDKAIK